MRLAAVFLLLGLSAVLGFDFQYGIVAPYHRTSRSEQSPAAGVPPEQPVVGTGGLVDATSDSNRVENVILDSNDPQSDLDGRKFVPGYSYVRKSVPARAGDHPVEHPQHPSPSSYHEPAPVYRPASYQVPSYPAYGPSYSRRVILERIFSNDRPVLDPKQKDEDLQWDNLNEFHPLDDPDVDPNLYFNNAHTVQEVDHWKAVTIPHRVTKANSDIAETNSGMSMNVGIFDKYEASMSSDPIEINYGDRLMAKARISAESVGTENHPFPKDLVTDPQDDQRFGSVGVALISTDPVPLQVGWVITNVGLWSIYSVSGDPYDASIQSFVQTKRLARRVSKRAIHNLGLEYDEQYNKVTFFIEGKAVWTIDNLGLPSYDPYAVTIVRSNGNRTRIVKPKQFVTNVGSYSYLQSTDPLNKYSNTILVRLDDSFSLADDLSVYDEESLLCNRVFGQGTLFRLYELEISKHERNNYGHVQPSYQQVPPYAPPHAPSYVAPYAREGDKDLPKMQARSFNYQDFAPQNLREVYRSGSAMPSFNPHLKK